MARLNRHFLFSVLILLLLFQSEARPQIQTWKKQFPSAALSIGTNPLNPNSLYAEGDSGRLYASYDRGGTWSFVSSTGILDGIRQILIHPSDTSVWFCAGEVQP